ncbi:hypothetical protein LINGRAHAP2_LOCUS21511, partial [Linum grandiflorum]
MIPTVPTSDEEDMAELSFMDPAGTRATLRLSFL